MNRSCVLALLALTACGAPNAVRLGSDAGAVLSTSLDGGLVTLSFAGSSLLTLPLDGVQFGTVPKLEERLSYDPYWLEQRDSVFSPAPPPGLRWKAAKAASVKTVDASTVEVTYSYDGASASLSLHQEADGRFSAKVLPTLSEPDSAIAYIRLRLRASSEEAFYGLGEWLDSVNHRGHRRAMQAEPDLEIESAYSENHVVTPFLIGTRGWGVFVESRRCGLFDVAKKENDLIEVTFGTAEQSAQGLQFHLYAAAHPLDVTKLYYDTTGAPALPAPWAMGPWVWRNENRDQAQVLDDIRQLRTRDLATSGLWIDRPYASFVNSFDFLPTQFPNPREMANAIAASGLGFALWHTPYVEPGAPQRARAETYFPPVVGAKLNKWSSIIDFTAPGAVEWWRQNLRAYTDLGVRGFKLDFAEDVAPGVSGNRIVWKFADGSDERTMQSLYPLAYHRTYVGLFEPETYFLLTRAGRWGSQTYAPIIWPGDIDATLTKYGEQFTDGAETVTGVGGLPAAVIAGLSLGPSGFAFFAADTGGYRHSPPNKETFIRWVEQSALMAVMQTGDSSSQMPWEFNAANGRDDEALGVYRTFARLHLRLFPYVWSYAKRLPVDGRPISRALGLAYPSLGKHPDDEYLLGDELLVAPVVKAGARTRTLTVPPGAWLDWFSGRELGAGEVTVDAPLTSLPLFVRRGALVPMLRPTIDTLKAATDVGVESFENDVGTLWVRVAPGSPGTFSLYDGTALEQKDKLVRVTPGTVFVKGVAFEIMATAKPASVRIDGSVAAEGSAWNWSADLSGTITVNVGPGAHEVSWE